ncbi:hypothetical protein LIA77_04826 [Sarocladium implicatum]|nr:hypothetical protein LIA77_04826 [Sarocladium implicatum]
MRRPQASKHAVSLVFCILMLSISASASAPPAVTDVECPTSLDVTVPGHVHSPFGDSHLEDYGSMQRLHSLMSNCSSISDLKLRITLLGCSEWPDRWNFPFNQDGTDSFPSRPTRLSLEGYDFAAKEWGSNQPPKWHHLLPGPGALWEWEKALRWLFGGLAHDWYRMWSLPAEQRHKNNLELWLDAMDFSAVTNLTLHDSLDGAQADAVVKLLPSRLPALRVLNVKGPWAQDFVTALPKHSLSHFTWRSSGLSGTYGIRSPTQSQGEADGTDAEVLGESREALLDNIWEHVGGPQLESFEFRDDDGVDGEGPGEILSSHHLRTLAAAAPGIRSLTLDMKRGNYTWPETELELIARELPALESLTLNLELASHCRQQDMNEYGLSPWDSITGGSFEKGCSGEDQFMKPLIDESSASHLFDFIYRANVEGGGGKFEKLQLFAGDWSRPWDGPLYFPGWLEGRRAWASCSIRSSDQAAGQYDGAVTTICEAEDRRIG